MFIGCEVRNADVVFMVDTSGSIELDRFQLIIHFIKDTVQLFPIGLQDNLVGVILFSNNAYLRFNVQTYTNISTLLTALDNLLYFGGGTNTAAALDLLLSSAQDGRLELRPGHPHIAVLITDGISTINPEQTIPNAQSIHASNIFQQVYAVGINDAHISELNAIASNLSLVFSSNTFTNDALNQLQQGLSHQLCRSSQQKMISS